MCHPQSRKYWVFGCGTIFVLLSVLAGLLWPPIVEKILRNELQLRKGTLNYKNWVETPVPMYLKFTFFNWTNAGDVGHPNYKPHLVEMGPYVFIEKHTRVNISFHPENDTVSYDQIRTWHFVPDMSNGTLDDEVTSVNVIAALATYALRHSSRLRKYAANLLMESLEVELSVTKSVRELTFEGYFDWLWFIARIFELTIAPFDKFGWFVDRNGSWTYDGHFEMRSGQKDITRMGSLTKWNYVNKTRFYHDKCSEISGTSGELWPMDMDPKGDISIFVTDICRPIKLAYQQKHTKFGITGSRWVGDSRVFDNGVAYPPNACYCTGAPASCPDLLPGVQNISDCRYEAPLFASFPHFYLAHESYVNSVSGLSPNQSLHEFSLSLEPSTGIPLDVDAKIQINTLIQPLAGFKFTEKAPKVMIPAFWISQTVSIDEKQARNAKMAIEMPLFGVYTSYGVGGLGIILLIVGAVLICTQIFKTCGQTDDDVILVNDVILDDDVILDER